MAHKDLTIVFVHTPMASVSTPGREKYWLSFDKRYYMAHPNLTPADASIWELPHWMTWLGGVLAAEGYTNVKALSLYTTVDVEKGIDEEFITSEFKNNPADVYLYSPMTPNLHFAYHIATIAKSLYPKSKNVFGGIISTPLHIQVASHPSVDYVVRDRGEYALPALLKTLANKDDIYKVKNLTFKEKNNRLWSHPELYPYMEPKDIPFPLYDLFPKEIGKKLRYIRQNYALGCPFKCSFCTIQTIGRKPGYFPIERVLSEIKSYRSHYGANHNIYFGDETFTLNTEKTLEICEALESDSNITYDIQTRLMSLNNANVLKSLKKSGCKWVEIGLETMVQKSMFVHKQGTNLSKIKDQLKRLRDEGLPTCSYIVHGLPEQTPDEMRMSIDIVCELLNEKLLHCTYFNTLVPYPGSSLYKNPEIYGIKIKHHDYKYYNEDIEPVFETAYSSSQEIHKIFIEGITKIAQAMDSKPYLGEPLKKSVLNCLGKSLAHN